MKYIYLVRHGESESNAGTAGIGDPILTEKGMEQARMIADRCAHLPVDLVISSTQKRAKKTAETIRDKIKKPLEFSDLLIERRPPTECIGMKEPEWEKIRKVIDQNFATPGYRYSDEEGFDDLNRRATQVIELLSSKMEEHIVVVTHGTFMRVIVGRILFGDVFDSRTCLALFNGLRTHNTGLTILVHKSDEEGGDIWRVMTWNDYAHLG